MMTDTLEIGQVAAATGLSLRALRFYEARGLVSPMRTAGGRRIYGRGDLARLNAAVALKRAGFSLSQIGSVLAGRQLDLGRLIDAQIDSVAEQARQLADIRTLLLSIKSRIDRGEPIDVATLCSLIRFGDVDMTEQSRSWERITGRYWNEEAKADFAAAAPKLDPDFSQADYSARWKDLGTRIKDALPMDPASDTALAFVREWFALLAPFSAVATPAMWEASSRMYANMDEWQGKDGADPGFDSAVWQFVQAATTAARAAGHDIGPVPSFMAR